MPRKITPASSLDTLRKEAKRWLKALARQSSKVPKNFLELDEARMILAQDAGFPSWKGLREGSPGITLNGTKVFPSRVRVRYTT